MSTRGLCRGIRRAISLAMQTNVYSLRDSDGFVTLFIDRGVGQGIEITESHAIWNEETGSFRMTRKAARKEWRKMVSQGAVRTA